VWWLHELVRPTTVVVTTAVLDMGRTGAVATITVAPDARRTRMARTTVGLDAGPTFTALTADLAAVTAAALLELATADRIMWLIGVTGRQGLVARRFMVATAADRALVARAGSVAAVLAEDPGRVAQVALPAGALAVGPARVVLAAAATMSSLT